MDGLANMSASINAPSASVRRDRCVVCLDWVTYSVAPTAQQVVGQGVLRLQLDGFIQVILKQSRRQTDKDRQRDRQGRQFSLLIHDTSAVSLPSVLTWSVLLHQPTSISQTPHTRDLAETTHSRLSRTHPPCLPPSFFSILPLSMIQFFFVSVFPLQLSISLSPVKSF